MRRIVGILAGMTLAMTVSGVVLWITGQQVAAAIVVTTTATLWLALIIAVTIAITSWWTRQTMRDGAEIALRSQDINDRWDASKMGSLVSLVREGARIGRGETTGQGRNSVPPLLVSGQNSDEAWLPDLIEFNTPSVEIEPPPYEEKKGNNDGNDLRRV